jgi:hypothetical protein
MQGKYRVEGRGQRTDVGAYETMHFSPPFEEQSLPPLPSTAVGHYIWRGGGRCDNG